jgi:hypothetical protein
MEGVKARLRRGKGAGGIWLEGTQGSLPSSFWVLSGKKMATKEW